MDDNRKKALAQRSPDREAIRQGLGNAPRRCLAGMDFDVNPDRLARAHIALGVGGLRAAAWSRSTARILRQTTLTLEVIAQCQKLGGTAAFVDASTRSTRRTREARRQGR